MYKRQVGNYRPGAAEDWELWLRLATADHALVRLGTPCLAMRFHPGSVSAAHGYRERLAACLLYTSRCV